MIYAKGAILERASFLRGLAKHPRVEARSIEDVNQAIIPSG